MKVDRQNYVLYPLLSKEPITDGFLSGMSVKALICWGGLSGRFERVSAMSILKLLSWLLNHVLSWLQEITLVIPCFSQLTIKLLCTDLKICPPVTYFTSMSTLNSQMWTNVKKTNTTAQRMPLVRTPRAHSSASATEDIRGTAWPVRVSLTLEIRIHNPLFLLTVKLLWRDSRSVHL